MQSVVDLINRTSEQVEGAAQYNEGRESISRPSPDINDPIHVPKIGGKSALPVLLPTSNRQSNSPPEAASNPVRRLAPVNGGIPAARPISDSRSSFDNGVRNGISSPQDISLRSPNLPMPPPESDGPIGIFSGKPMPRWPIPPPIFDTRDNSGAAAGNWLTSALLRGRSTSQPSSDDANGSPVPFAPNRPNSFNTGNAATPPSDPGSAIDPPASPSQDSQGPLTLNDAFLEYLKRLNANQPPVGASDQARRQCHATHCQLLRRRTTMDQ
jgi:hypothetical protein